MQPSHPELARLCELAYSDVAPATIDGYQLVATVEREEQRVLICETGEYQVIVFRGTASGYTGTLDLLCRPEPVDFMVKAHRGFLRAWNSVREELLQLVSGRPLYITGHSLGGAMAVLMANDGDCIMPHEVVTFGQPRVYQRSVFTPNVPLVRYVNSADIVPRVPLDRLKWLLWLVQLASGVLPPLLSLLIKRLPDLPSGYQHFGRLVYLDRNGRHQGDCSKAYRAYDCVVGSLSHVGTKGLNAVKCHSMQRYREILESLEVK